MEIGKNDLMTWQDQRKCLQSAAIRINPQVGIFYQCPGNNLIDF